MDKQNSNMILNLFEYMRSYTSIVQLVILQPNYIISGKLWQVSNSSIDIFWDICTVEPESEHL